MITLRINLKVIVLLVTLPMFSLTASSQQMGTDEKKSMEKEQCF